MIAHPCSRALSGDTLIHHDFFTSRIDIQHGHWTLRTERQPSRARDTAAGCPLPRCPRIPPAPTAPTRVRRAGVLSPTECGSTVPRHRETKLGHQSKLPIDPNCQSVQSVQMPISPKYQSNLPIDPRPLPCVLLRPAPHAAALLPLSHAPIHSRIICCRGRAVRYSEWHATACCIRSRRRGSLTTAPPRLAPPRPHPSLYPELTGGFMSTRVGRRRCRRVCQRSQGRSYRRSNRRSRRRHIAHTVSPHVRRRCVQLATTPLNYRRRVAEGIRFQRQKG